MKDKNRINIFYESFSNELLGKFQRLHQLVVNHHESSGNYHEEILRVALMNFLTKRYSVRTGFIYKDADHISSQVDIIVIDEHVPVTYLFQEGNFAIVVPEAVVACVEVKTTLTKREFNKALKNILSAKRLVNEPSRMAGIIFGYQLYHKSERRPNDKLMEKWFKEASVGGLEAESKFFGPEAIIWLNNNFALVQSDPKELTIGDSKNYYRYSHTSGLKGWQITFLLTFIVDACERSDFFNRRLIRPDEPRSRLHSVYWALEHSEYRFKLGEGKGEHYQVDKTT